MARSEKWPERWARLQSDPGWPLDQAKRELACATYLEEDGGWGSPAGHRVRARELLERVESCLRLAGPGAS